MGTTNSSGMKGRGLIEPQTGTVVKAGFEQ